MNILIFWFTVVYCVYLSGFSHSFNAATTSLTVTSALPLMPSMWCVFATFSLGLFWVLLKLLELKANLHYVYALKLHEVFSMMFCFVILCNSKRFSVLDLALFVARCESHEVRTWLVQYLIFMQLLYYAIPLYFLNVFLWRLHNNGKPQGCEYCLYHSHHLFCTMNADWVSGGY